MSVSPLRVIAVAALGGPLGLLAETVHQRAGVWSLQAGPALPWWIAVVYGLALAAAGLFFTALERGGGERLVVSPGVLAAEVLLLALLFLAPVALRDHELTLTGLALVYVGARLLCFRAPGDLLAAAMPALFDVALEAGLVSAAIYRYPTSRFALPLWLLPLWAGLSLSLRRLLVVALGRPGRADRPRS